MECFSTHGLPSAQKVSFWNSISSEVFAAMEISPFCPAQFDGEIRREALGALTLTDVRSAAVCIRHTSQHLARQSCASYLLLAPLNGPMELEVAGSSPLLVPAQELRLLDNARPYTIRHGDDLQTLCLDIPHDVLGRIVAQPDRLVGVRPEGGPRATRALITLMRSLSLADDPGPPQAGAATPLTDALLALVGAAFADPHSRPAPTDGRSQRILAAIDARAGDAALRQEDIAAQLGCSARYLRLTLARSGESFARYLLRRRLERAACLLRDQTRAARSVTDVALECGFNSATHFGYAFRQHFGVTPSRYRHRGD